LSIVSIVVAFVVPAVLVISPSVASASTGPSIASLATANVGKKACSINSRGGIAFDSSCTGNGGQAEYWCADFARWVWAISGVADTSSLTAAAGSFYTYGLEYGTLSSTPAVGDAVVFNYHGGGDADHVAIVTAANANGTIESMSGDWNGESGSEAHFASTSSVVANAPAYIGVVGSSSSMTGMTISAFVAPVGVTVAPVIGGSALFAPQSLIAGQKLTSPNGLYVLSMLSDGNLVEDAGGRQMWSTSTEGNIGARAVIQTDGNLVVYSVSHKALWASNTGGHSGVFTLIVQDNAALVINGQSGALWSRRPPTAELLNGQILSSGQRLVAENGMYTLYMQSDGNLVEWTAGRPLWDTRTEGDIGAHAMMQADGNLVLFASNGTALWSSKTGGHSGSFTLALQTNADLVISGPSGTLWSNHI
jgi:hypothetical protein